MARSSNGPRCYHRNSHVRIGSSGQRVEARLSFAGRNELQFENIMAIAEALLADRRRPLSKTVRFNVLRVIPAGAGGGKKAFTGF